MRKFLEIIEQLPEADVELGVLPEMVRTRVDDKTDAEIKVLAQQLVSKVSNPKARTHDCYHDEYDTKPCTFKEIKLIAPTPIEVMK